MSNSSTYAYRPSIFRTALYYCHRGVVNPLLRRFVVSALGRWVGRRADTGEDVHGLLKSVKEHGIVELGQVLNETKCADILAYLSDKPVYDKNLFAGPTFCDAQPDDMAFGTHFVKDVLDCPHIMELVSSPSIVQLAGDYLGCTPTLSCLGVQWSFPTNSPSISQTFHRDTEDWKYLRFFVYLTDVDEGCGPHVYVKGSHRSRLPLRLKLYRPEEISQQYGSDSVVKIFGSRGTGIAADTSGIHKGELPTAKARLVLNFTFSILPNPMSEYTPCHTRHSPGLNNYTNRLFLR
jgi:hypothetical protein